jgi:hypothetical protein
MKTQLIKEVRKEYNNSFKLVNVSYWVLSHGENVLKDVKCNSKDGRNIAHYRAFFENEIKKAEQFWSE